MSHEKPGRHNYRTDPLTALTEAADRIGFQLAETTGTLTLMLRACAAGLVLVAIAGSLLLTRERNRSYSSCDSNLRQIDAAKQQWALDRGKGTNDIPAWNDLIGTYVKEPPKCPQGGTYRINRVYDRPTCSYPGHELSK